MQDEFTTQEQESGEGETGTALPALDFGDDAAVPVELAESRPPAMSDSERVLLARLRDAMLASDPAIPAELVRGDSLEALEASFAAAKDALRRVREAVAREQPAIPAGAPGRLAHPPANALAKIRAGLDRLG